MNNIIPMKNCIKKKTYTLTTSGGGNIGLGLTTDKAIPLALTVTSHNGYCAVLRTYSGQIQAHILTDAFKDCLSTSVTVDLYYIEI